MVLELSEWQARLRDKPRETLQSIDRMINNLGRDRVIWGSDFPGIRSSMPLKECVELFQGLPALGAQHGFSFNASDVDAILGDNVARILGLK